MTDEIRNYILKTKVEREINKIIIHCSATAEGRPFGVEDIRRWHTKDRGWSDIGYHFVITLDGRISKGRSLSKIGAHCFGQNVGSIGICYIGGCAADGKTAKDTRTVAQKASLYTLLQVLRKRYPDAEIFGHHDFNLAKACPCFDARKEYANLKPI